jgi:hypothetical protein
LTGSLGVQIVEPPIFFITVAQSRRIRAALRRLAPFLHARAREGFLRSLKNSYI